MNGICPRCGGFTNRAYGADLCHCEPERKLLEPIPYLVEGLQGDEIPGSVRREHLRAWKAMDAKIREVGPDRAAAYFDELADRETEQAIADRTAKIERARLEVETRRFPQAVRDEQARKRREEEADDGRPEPSAPRLRPDPFFRPDGPPRRISMGEGAHGVIDSRRF